MDLPIKFREKMQDILGNEYDAFIKTYDEKRWAALRINTLKGTDKKLLSLFGETLTPVPWTSDGYFYPDTIKPGKSPLHEAGAYYIQEPSAMLPAELLEAQPGECVLDLCAAPGGKTTKIAADMKGKGLLVANEIHPKRAAVLSSNVERMGIKNAVVTNESSDILLKRFPEFFDRILVDAPCSGEGMFRKDEEAIAQWSEANVIKCAVRQKEILTNAAGMLRPGGRLVYSTCTFSPEENEKVIISFLNDHPDFSIEKAAPGKYISNGRPKLAGDDERAALTLRIWPHLTQGEGHFAAVLKKNGESKSPLRQNFSPDCPKEYENLYKDFADEFLKNPPEGKISAFGENLYIVPEPLPGLNGIKVLRFGLHLGTVKKNRFEPGHSLAMALNPHDGVQCKELDINDSNIFAYLRGETIPAEDLKGWCLVSVSGYTTGWGKASGGIIKNHYPKGLRKTL